MYEIQLILETSKNLLLPFVAFTSSSKQHILKVTFIENYAKLCLQKCFHQNVDVNVPSASDRYWFVPTFVSIRFFIIQNAGSVSSDRDSNTLHMKVIHYPVDTGRKFWTSYVRFIYVTFCVYWVCALCVSALWNKIDWGLQQYLKRDSDTDVSLWILQNYKNGFFHRTLWWLLLDRYLIIPSRSNIFMRIIP